MTGVRRAKVGLASRLPGECSMKIALRAKSVSKKITLITTAFVLAVSTLTASVPFILSQKASALTTIATSSYGGSLANAVAAAEAGDTIVIDTDITISERVAIVKPLTIQGDGAVTVTVTKVNGLNAIGIQSSNVTVKGLNFKSTWNINDTNDYNNVTVRALEVSPSVTNALITGNTFTDLRQPAYLGESSTGTISNNTTTGTKGWVTHASSDYTFVGNNWGINVLDIAIIPSATNSYSDSRVVAISDLNNDATVERQQGGGVNFLSDAYVTPSAGANAGRGDNGSKWNPYANDIQSGLNRIVEGGTVHVADGEYTGTANITKNGTKLIGQTNSRDAIKFNVTPLSGQAGVFANGVNDITIKNIGIFGDTFNSNGALIKLNDGKNARIENVVVKNAQAPAKVSGIDINSYSNVTIAGVFIAGMTKDGVSVTARQNTTANVSKNITIQESAISNAAWSSVAFYTKTTNGYTDNIQDVTISNVSTQYGDRGIYIDGAGGTVTSPGVSRLVLQNVTVGQNNNEYINNEQSADIDARSLKVNIGNGVVVPVSSMDQSQYDTVLGKIKDKYNNNNASSNYGFVWLIDVSAPTLRLKTSAGVQLTSGAATQSKDVVAEWTKPVGASKFIYKYWNSIPGNQWTAAHPAVASDLTELSRSGSFTEGNGTHFIQVFAVDVNGNVSSGSNVFEITYDTKKPVASTVTVTPNPAKTIDGTVRLNVTINDELTNVTGAKYTLYNNDTEQVIAKNVDISGAYGSKNVTVNTLIDISNLPKATYRIQLFLYDQAGNQGKATASFVISNDDTSAGIVLNDIDTTTFPGKAIVSGTVVYNADGTKVVPGQEVEVEVNSKAYTARSDDNGKWSVTTDALVNEEYVAYVTVGSVTKTQLFTINVPATDNGDNDTPIVGGGTTTPNSPEVSTPQAPQNSGNQQNTNTTPSITGPTAFAAILGANDVVADTPNNGTGAEDVKGTSTENNLAAAVDGDNTDGNAFGLAWYWWLLIVAALAAVIWWIVSMIRGRQAQS